MVVVVIVVVDIGSVVVAGAVVGHLYTPLARSQSQSVNPHASKQILSHLDNLRVVVVVVAVVGVVVGHLYTPLARSQWQSVNPHASKQILSHLDSLRVVVVVVGVVVGVVPMMVTVIEVVGYGLGTWCKVMRAETFYGCVL